jgi:hypothetical protein
MDRMIYLVFSPNLTVTWMTKMGGLMLVAVWILPSGSLWLSVAPSLRHDIPMQSYRMKEDVVTLVCLHPAI